MDLSDRIANLAAPATQAVGLVVDDVRVTSSGSRTRVLVTVDLPADAVGSADLDAIAQASRGIGAALDEAGVPEGAYVLEVSTPGIDRPLTDRHHFKRARTRLVAFALTDGTSLTARIIDVDDAGVHVDSGGDSSVLEWDRIERGEIQIEFKKAED